MRVNENVRRVRQTIETRMFFCFSVVLQLVFVHLSNNIFMNTATNVNNIKKINFFFFSWLPDLKPKWFQVRQRGENHKSTLAWKILLIVFGLMAVDPLKGQILPSLCSISCTEVNSDSLSGWRKKRWMWELWKRISPVSWTQLFSSACSCKEHQFPSS